MAGALGLEHPPSILRGVVPEGACEANVAYAPVLVGGGIEASLLAVK